MPDITSNLLPIILSLVGVVAISFCIAKIIEHRLFPRFFSWFWSFSEMRWMVALCVVVYFASFFLRR